MNTLPKSITHGNFKSSAYLRRPSGERRVACEYTHPPRSPFPAADAVRDTAPGRESAQVKKLPLPPAKPPMRLERKRA